MTKFLITAGCSFSVQYGAWPKALNNIMNPNKTLVLGLQASSNGLISKRTIFHTLEALKEYKPNEILVGVMWTGSSRSEFYSTDSSIEPYGMEIVNPSAMKDYLILETKLFEIKSNNPKKNYYLLNPHWEGEYCKNYYKYYYDRIGSVIETLEHILNVQWFLKSVGVPYFMMRYYNDVFEENKFINLDGVTLEITEHPDVKYLYDLIDFNQWIDEDCQSWVNKYSNLPFPKENDPHPSYEQHRLYTEQVIIPFLQRKKLWQLKNQNPV